MILYNLGSDCVSQLQLHVLAGDFESYILEFNNI